MSIVTLTGFMATGKTTIGKRLAARLGVPFVDTDVQVSASEAMPIPAIFAAKGESYFRTAERAAVANAVVKDAVVATGGGAIVDPANLAAMRNAGPIVCLTADVDTILARTSAERGRPLLAVEDRRLRVESLLAERATAYAQADFTIDTSRMPVETVVDRIIAFVGKTGRGEVVR